MSSDPTSGGFRLVSSTQAQQESTKVSRVQESKNVAATTSDNAAREAMLDATLINLRSRLLEIERDNWKYEAPRHTYQ